MILGYCLTEQADYRDRIASGAEPSIYEDPSPVSFEMQRYLGFVPSRVGAIVLAYGAYEPLQPSTVRAFTGDPEQISEDYQDLWLRHRVILEQSIMPQRSALDGPVNQGLIWSGHERMEGDMGYGVLLRHPLSKERVALLADATNDEQLEDHAFYAPLDLVEGTDLLMITYGGVAHVKRELIDAGALVNS
jgi:hypothetical protein